MFLDHYPRPHGLFPCVVCDSLVAVEPGSYDICPICMWEDCGERDLNALSGPNHTSIARARVAYAYLGACDQHAARMRGGRVPAKVRRAYLRAISHLPVPR